MDEVDGERLKGIITDMVPKTFDEETAVSFLYRGIPKLGYYETKFVDLYGKRMSELDHPIAFISRVIAGRSFEAIADWQHSKVDDYRLQDDSKGNYNCAGYSYSRALELAAMEGLYYTSLKVGEKAVQMFRTTGNQNRLHHTRVSLIKSLEGLGLVQKGFQKLVVLSGQSMADDPNYKAPPRWTIRSGEEARSV